jgi:isoleucyl-tRNA synthetase
MGFMQGNEEQPVKGYDKELNNNKSSIALREEAILNFWEENNTFKKSLEKDAPKGNYVFYDGPPFATGLPHYGHILGSTAKDVIGRYQTMQGFRVPRRWGWDCHGLPIENIVEKELGISGKKAVEEYGIDKFSEYARSKVLTYVSEWEKTVNRIGRWVDFENSYKTMDNSFIESVWWALSEMDNKGLIYEGVRVLAYCPRCETPIANSEIAMDNSYKDITDISVYVKFKLTDEDNTYLLAWTTTPWTLPGNTAIAVNKDIDYVKVKLDYGNDTIVVVSAENGIKKDETIQKSGVYILAKERLSVIKGNHEILEEIKGSDLVGLSYEPVFDYYKDVDMPNKENIWKIWHADFVTADQGTGIAHEAPAFGEDDMNLAKENNIPFIRHVEPNGIFSKEVSDFEGLKAKPKEDHQATDVAIIKYLAHNGALFAKEKIIHSYPHCYRCETPLLYYALPSWFVNIQKVKSNLLKSAESMNWIPSHLKDGRFLHTMESAPDWTISRNRYWASPLPIWKSKDGKIIFIKSFEDLKNNIKKSGNKYFVMRHGQTNNNIKNVVSIVKNSGNHLTELGKEEIISNVKNLEGEGIDLIFTSPFNRTKETTEIVKNVLGLNDDQVIEDDRLSEMSLPMYEGKTWTEYHTDYPKTVENFDRAPEGNESYAGIKRRMMSFLFEIEEKYKNKKILIVTHGGPAWLMVAGAKALDINQTLELIRQSKDFHYFSNAEIHKLDFTPFPHDANYNLDFHRPYIDKILFVDQEGNEYKRIPEVIDCWFESGSMPFAQDHYPFERPNWKEENFPAGFVAEYIAQTRTWFYYTHVISTVLFEKAPFQNVVTTGTVLAEDGQKMSKSKNNFPDPSLLFDKFGVDSIRFYLMSCPVMKGEDFNFSEKGVHDITSKIITRLDNVVTFYELYRDKNLEKDANVSKSENVLDVWIMARLNQLLDEVTNGMAMYDMVQATRPFDGFIEDLSTWYLRRSRESLKDGSKEAKQTLYFVLKTISQLLAPFTPFIAEDIWRKLKSDTDVESVHLTEWPKNEKIITDKELQIISQMSRAREIVTLGLEARQKANIKVRQPLHELVIRDYGLGEEYSEIIKDELNIKNISTDISIENEVKLNTHITEELRIEGQYRELVRAIQDMRKKAGLNPNDVINLSIETNVDGQELINKFKNEILKTVGASEIKISENNGTEIKIDELVFVISFLQ